jgi:hypothetical protein
MTALLARATDASPLTALLVALCIYAAWTVLRDARRAGR